MDTEKLRPRRKPIPGPIFPQVVLRQNSRGDPVYLPWDLGIGWTKVDIHMAACSTHAPRKPRKAASRASIGPRIRDSAHQILKSIQDVDYLLDPDEDPMPPANALCNIHLRERCRTP